MLIQEPIHATIWHCLNHYAYNDAIFLSERLFSEVGSDESLHLLATSYYRSGKTARAYNLLNTEGARTPQNKFLLAKCCSDLDKFSEAEAIFNGGSGHKIGNLITKDAISKFGDASSFALQLMAKVYGDTERTSQAIECEKAALKLNPFLWKSFAALCQLGDIPDPSKIFNYDNIDDFVHCQGRNPILEYANKLALNQCNPPATQIQNSQTNFNLLSHIKTSSVTSTPINAQQPGLNPQQSKLSVPIVDVTPQPTTGIPVPRLMVTPVNNHVESSLANNDSCFTGSPLPESSRLMSGIGAFNSTTDTDCGIAPPKLVVGRRKRAPGHDFSHVENAGSLLFVDNSCDQAESQNSFGVLPRGTLSMSNFGVKINSDFRPNARARLDFHSLAVLSPFGNPGCDSAVTSTPQSFLASPHGSNNEPKTSKRGLTESNLTKLNVITPSNQKDPVGSNFIGSSSSGVATSSGLSNPGSVSSSQSVRRSSRLVVSSQQSKSKENSKSVNAAPLKTARLLRSPSRKSSKTSLSTPSNRLNSNSTVVDLAAEKNEKNRDRLRKEKDIGSPSVTVTPMPFPGIPSSETYPDQTNQMLRTQALVIQRHCAEGLLQLFQQFGKAFVELSRFNSQKAISFLEEIPLKHRSSGWVLGHSGKAHFELGEYKEACRYFKEVHELDPFHMELMEYYSTALWHLQEEIALSALAKELSSADKLAPETWCAMGNCFSYQKEHENSIKFLRRAVQIDPDFAYAYTLLGHEYVMIEELDLALACFRSAVRVDARHYNAWYGIGLTYYKQERFQLTEFYYKKALAINPNSSILMCHVAVVQHALQKSDKALETLNRALLISPKNPVCKFEKASILIATERYQEALNELNELKALAPRESPVYFLIGKVHNKLNNTHLALMHFSWAMDLDPKVANSQIKDALDPTLARVAHEDSDLDVDHSYQESGDDTDDDNDDLDGPIDPEDVLMAVVESHAAPQENSQPFRTSTPPHQPPFSGGRESL